MLTKFPKIEYNYEQIRLEKIFQNDDAYVFPNCGIQTSESLKVFGELRFPEFPEDRTYNLASFVTSIDGRIAFPDNPAGPIVAQANGLDPRGADADFWILNLMRASADVCFAGAGTLKKEPDGLVCIFDKGLEDARTASGKPIAPWVVICSLDGTDIPFGDSLIRNQPVMFNTAPEGLKIIKNNLKQDFYVVGPYEKVSDIDTLKVQEEFHKNRRRKIPVIVTGKNRRTDSRTVMKILKLMGMDTAIVESPSFCHSLLGEGLLDEITLNYSCVYIGGSAVGLGNGMEPFTSKKHPHTRMLSIHTHGPRFFYFRHRFIYDVEPGKIGS